MVGIIISVAYWNELMRDGWNWLCILFSDGLSYWRCQTLL